MKKCLGSLMVIAGLAMIVFTFGSFFADARLIASNCNLKCGQDNKACQEPIEPADCPCNPSAQTNGRRYSNNPTYGSETGNLSVTYESVLCWTALLCGKGETLSNSTCYMFDPGDGFPIDYFCIPFPLLNCQNYVETDGAPNNYMNCVSHDCGE